MIDVGSTGHCGSDDSGAPVFALSGADALRNLRVHLIGVGGSGMSSLAAYLVGSDCQVTGSDMARSEAVETVESIGVRVAIGHSPANLAGKTDLVVLTAAVAEKNRELQEARRRYIPVLKYAQMIGALMRLQRGVAVAGTHGKTTTSSMVSLILLRAGMAPSYMIGANNAQLDGRGGLGGAFGKGNILVAEACEYDRSFWNFRPEVAVITNVDRDHMDYFRDDADLVDAFRGFAQRAKPGGALIFNADDARSCEAVSAVDIRKITFGFGPAADWRAEASEIRRVEGVTRFRVRHGGTDAGEFRLIVPGRHNVMNGLAAAAAAAALEVDIDAIRAALAEYRGAGRRLEHVATVKGIDVIDDYGHHPTEIAATLSALRDDYPDRRLWCVFQPHQYSRTRMLLDDFAKCFGQADRVVLPDIFPARDKRADIQAVSSMDVVNRLRQNGVQADYAPTYEEAADFLTDKLDAGDVVLTMGAGPVNRVGRLLLRRLRVDESRIEINANGV